MHYTHLTHEECDEELFLETRRAMEFRKRLEEWLQQRLDSARKHGRWDQPEFYGMSKGRIAAFEDVLGFIEGYSAALQS